MSDEGKPETEEQAAGRIVTEEYVAAFGCAFTHDGVRASVAWLLGGDYAESGGWQRAADLRFDAWKAERETMSGAGSDGAATRKDAEQPSSTETVNYTSPEPAPTCARCGQECEERDITGEVYFHAACWNAVLHENPTDGTVTPALDERIAESKQSAECDARFWDGMCLDENDTAIVNAHARQAHRGGRQQAGLTLGVYPWRT
jgi:hypothetical protein